MLPYTITVAGDSALNIEFFDSISEENSLYVSSIARILNDAALPGVIECIPTYCSLMVAYNPLELSYKELKTQLDSLLSMDATTTGSCKRVFKVPVCYGGGFGPDIKTVCDHSGLSEDEVIRVHSSKDYLISMLGFLPGFCYLAGLDERLHTPRLESPRLKIDTGSVGIGGQQTGVYPLASPGGWQLLGRTPVKLYDPNRDPAIPYSAGDYLRFVPVTKEEYANIQQQVDAGMYEFDVVILDTVSEPCSVDDAKGEN